MPINQLSEINPGSRDWTINVYVSRLWQHRGGTDDGPIKHTDIVFQDKEGNHMYGEIATGLVNQFINRIREGKVYELRRFLVYPKKDNYRPVEGQFIIRFGKYTTVREIPDAAMDYPLCTYALTPINDLPRPSDIPEAFTDVLGIVTGVSPISQYHSASRSTPSTKRVVYLSDLSGHQISLVLWGERAIAFDGEEVLRTAAKEPVVVIFVGTLVKPFEGRRGLSGGAPCRWYINEDLPEINELHARLKGKIPAVQGISLPGQTPAEISAQVDLDTKTVKELADLNIWEHQKTRFYCTVVITKLSPAQRWWFHACTTCNKGTVPFGAAYKCPDKNCGGEGGMPRYRLCYMGSDDTDELEFVFFDKAGKELIGKPVLTLLRSRVPHGMLLEEAVQFARTDQSIPRELATIVTQKYRMVVSVTTKSFDPEVDKPSYQVHRIDMQYGKKPHSSALRRRSTLALASSSSSGSELNTLGETLAEHVADDLSDVPASTDLTGSSVVAETIFPPTPPSVKKPPGSSDAKKVNDSSIKKALFPESPPLAESENTLKFVPSVQVTEAITPVVDDPNPTPVPTTVSSAGKTNRLRSQPQGPQVEPDSKKKKS